MNLNRFRQLLSKKIVTFYKLAKDQLSKQYHYDWSLRSLKNAVKLAAKIYRYDLEIDEMIIVIRSLYQKNFPKLVYDDISIFNGIIKVISMHIIYCAFFFLLAVPNILCCARIYFQALIVPRSVILN